MEKNGKTKNIVLAVLLVAVVTLSIAYAVLSATLTVNGQATVKGTNWGVQFQAKTGSPSNPPICTATSAGDTTTASVTTQPTLTATSFSGLEAELKLPGDQIVCTWEVANTGSIAAKLATYTQGAASCTDSADCTTVKNNLTYTIKVNNATPVQGDELPATTGNVKDVVLTIKYNQDAQVVPTNDVTVTFGDTTFVYEQK